MSDESTKAESAASSEGEAPAAPLETAPAETAPVESAPPPAAAPQQVVYVTAPVPPKKKGNRGAGSLIAAASGILYTAILAIITVVIASANGRPAGLGFLQNAQFYVPVLFFTIGFILLVLILNRAAWWAYILGSLVLAVFVYFGTIGFGLLSTGIILATPSEAAARFASELRNPFIIVSALLAREVSIWIGAAIATRGRRVKARNLEARAAFDRELAEKRAEHERAAGASTAV